MKLSEAIYKTIQMFGKNIITKPSFVNILSDYHAFDDNPAAKNIIKILNRSGYSQKLLQLTTSQYDLLKTNAYSFEISSAHGLRNELVENILRIIVFAINAENGPLQDFSIEKLNSKYGCVDSNGNILIPFEYDKMRDFSFDYGSVIVCVKNYSVAEIYSTSGDLLFSGEDHLYLTNQSDLIIVSKEGKKGVIRLNGEIVIPCIYRNISTVNPKSRCKLFLVEAESGFGMLDYCGKQVIPPFFESISNAVDEEFDIIEAGMAYKYVYFNSRGEIAIIPDDFYKYDFVNYNEDKHKLAKGYRTPNGRKLIVTTHCDVTDDTGKIILRRLGEFHDGLAPAQQDTLWMGYVDINLEFKVRKFFGPGVDQWNYVRPFRYGMAEVGNNKGFGIIGVDGHYIANPIYEEIVHRNWCIILHKYTRWIKDEVTTDYRVGDTTIIAFPKYKSFTSLDNCIFDISDEHKGRAFAMYEKYVGIFTIEGKIIEPIEYEWIRTWCSPNFNETTTISPVRRNGVWGELSLTDGFKPCSNERQERNENVYISKIEKGKGFTPYFYEYKTDGIICGFRQSNIHYLTVNKLFTFLDIESSLTDIEKKNWLEDNSEPIAISK